MWHYERTGEGPGLLLLHSFLCSKEMWRHQVDPLASRHTVVNVDLPGHGESPLVRRDIDFDALVGGALEVLDDAGVDRATWIGLSIGGMIAMRAALAHPDRVDALVVIDSDAGAASAPDRLRFHAMAAFARVAGLKPLLGTAEKSMFGATARRSNRALVDEWRARFAAGDVPSLVAIARLLAKRRDITADLARLDVPTLVMVGAEDSELPRPHSQAIADAIPGATLVEIAAAGHLCVLEQPGPVNETLTGFLDAL